MLKTHIKYLFVGTAALLTFNASAATNYFEARNDAMGGTGVASSTYGTAPLVNPALLSRYSGLNFFSLLLPTVGLESSSNGSEPLELDFSGEKMFKNYSAGKNLFSGILKNDVNAKVDAKFGSSAVFAVPLNFLPIDLFSVAVMAKAYGQTHFNAQIDKNDMDAVLNKTEVQGESKITSGKAALVQEVGLSLARNFTLFGTKVGLGVTPKYQCIKIWNGSESLKNYASSNPSTLSSAQDCSSGNAFNADIGAYADILGLATVGLAVQNVIPRQITSVATEDDSNGDAAKYTETYNIRKQITAGAAMNYKLINVALDIDLTPASGFSSDKQRQYISVGGELNLFFIQLRAGYRYNLLSASNSGLTNTSGNANDLVASVIENNKLIRNGNKVITAGFGLPGFDFAYTYDQDTYAHGITGQLVLAF